MGLDCQELEGKGLFFSFSPQGHDNLLKTSDVFFNSVAHLLLSLPLPSLDSAHAEHPSFGVYSSQPPTVAEHTAEVNRGHGPNVQGLEVD